MIQNEISYVEKLINKVFEQAQQGKIQFENDTIYPWVFHVKFYSQNAGTNREVPTVIIRDKKVFISNVSNYLSVARNFYGNDKEYYGLRDESFDEKLFMDLIVNATNYNLNNIENYVEQRTKMLQNNEVNHNTMFLGNCFGCNIYGKIEKTKSNLEGPFYFYCWLNANEERFILPGIYFGKVNDTINMFAIQAKRAKQDNKLAKKMDRYFRKANKDIDMEDEILSQVSTNALVSLIIFMAYQKSLGAKSINAYNFMPIRYNANLANGQLKTKNEKDKMEFIEKHDKNQFNITNRFMNTLIRYAHHFGYNYEYDDIQEKLIMDLSTKEKILSENIVYEIDEEVRKNIEDNKGPQLDC